MSAEALDTIAAAIAARYTSVNMPAPGGLSAVRLATATLPQAIAATPTVLVFPDSGQVLAQTTGTRRMSSRFLIRFYLTPRKDIGRETNQLRTWLPTLIGQHQAGVTLGGTVARVALASWRIGVLSYAGIEYSGAELAVDVETSIPWAATA